MSASGSPTSVSSQSKTAETSPSTKAKLPGLASPCTSVIAIRRFGSLAAELLGQALEGGQRAPLDPPHLAGPAVELAIEVGRAVAQSVEPRRGEVDRVDRHQLVDEPLAHPGDELRVGVELRRDDPLVHVTRHPLHDEELAAEDVTGRLEPQRAGARTSVGSRARRIRNWRSRS